MKYIKLSLSVLLATVFLGLISISSTSTIEARGWGFDPSEEEFMAQRIYKRKMICFNLAVTGYDLPSFCYNQFGWEEPTIEAGCGSYVHKSTVVIPAAYPNQNHCPLTGGVCEKNKSLCQNPPKEP